MKLLTILFATTVMLIAWYEASAQLQPESQRLAGDAVALMQKGDFSGAAGLLEQALKIERAAVPRNNKNIGTLAVNLARAKNTIARQKRMSTSSSSVGPVTLNSQLPVDDEIDAHYAEALSAFATLLPAEPTPWASAALEFGKVLQARPGGTGYETSAFEKVENHYKSSINRLTKEVGAESDQTLKLVTSLADLYHGSNEYERAFPLYQRFVKANESRTTDRAALVAPLRNFVQILVVSGQNAEADSYAKKIAAITGAEEKLPVIDITGRQINRNHLELFDLLAKANNSKPRSVWVDLVVDESGNVKEAKSEPNSFVDEKGKNVTEIAEKAARSWKFKPLVIDGTRRKTYGRVSYSFVPQR